MSDIKTVLRDLGSIFIVVGFVCLASILVPLYFSEYTGLFEPCGLIPILLTSSLFLALGMPLYFYFKDAGKTDFKSAMVTAALSWLCMSLFTTIPFLMMPIDDAGTKMDFLSAFFESMSGWTGTGLTMIRHTSQLSHTLQFWRTMIQWVGGVGVIVLTLSILARPGTGSYVLYHGEARDQKTHPSVVSTVRTIWWIYIVYSVIGVIGLAALGWLFPADNIGGWEALNHALTAIATGGFSVTDDSLIGYGAAPLVFIVLLMILGAIAFKAHYFLFKGNFKKFFYDSQLRAMIILLILGSIGLSLFMMSTYANVWVDSFGAAGFQFVSALTCTGFASADIPAWTETGKLILSFAMVIGGAAGSTAGGIKLYRAILLFKGLDWRIKRNISSPNRVFVHKLGTKPLKNDEAMDLINEAATISFMWVLILLAGVLVVSYVYPSQTLGSIVFEVCSAQGNVGLSAGITSITMDPVAKIMLIFNMWIGRLEIIPIVVLFRSFFGVRRNLI